MLLFGCYLVTNQSSIHHKSHFRRIPKNMCGACMALPLSQNARASFWYLEANSILFTMLDIIFCGRVYPPQPSGLFYIFFFRCVSKSTAKWDPITFTQQSYSSSVRFFLPLSIANLYIPTI